MNGAPNQVIAWHLPFNFTLNQTLPVGATAGVFPFTLNREIKDFEYEVGGSDDANIWNDGNTMAEDYYGIYDATRGEYVVTFTTRNLHAVKMTRVQLLGNFIREQLKNGLQGLNGLP